MAGSSLKQRVKAALAARATARLEDPDANALDYACDWIASGGSIKALAVDLTIELGTSVSRPFLSGVLHSFPDAEARLEAAKREGAGAMMDDAVHIADKAGPTPADVAKARLQVGVRQFMAEKFDPAVFGAKASATVNLNIGQLMLAALQAPPPLREIVTPPAVALLGVGLTLPAPNESDAFEADAEHV